MNFLVTWHNVCPIILTRDYSTTFGWLQWLLHLAIKRLFAILKNPILSYPWLSEFYLGTFFCCNLYSTWFPSLFNIYSVIYLCLQVLFLLLKSSSQETMGLPHWSETYELTALERNLQVHYIEEEPTTTIMGHVVQLHSHPATGMILLLFRSRCRYWPRRLLGLGATKPGCKQVGDFCESTLGILESRKSWWRIHCKLKSPPLQREEWTCWGIGAPEWGLTRRPALLEARWEFILPVIEFWSRIYHVRF
jgi:hypothetical protein